MVVEPFIEMFFANVFESAVDGWDAAVWNSRADARGYTPTFDSAFFTTYRADICDHD